MRPDPSTPNGENHLTLDEMPEPRLKNSIAILGCGEVGSTLAYTLILNPICHEVILVDPKTALLEAQVRDLNDATFRGNTGTRVRAGTHKDAGQADIVVITAGAKQKPGKAEHFRSSASALRHRRPLTHCGHVSGLRVRRQLMTTKS